MTIDPDGNGRIQFSQYGFDDDGDSITLEDVYLRAVDDSLQSPANQHPGWLQYSTVETTLADGRTQLKIDFDLPASQLDADVAYEIAIVISDATHPEVLGTFTLTTTQT